MASNTNSATKEKKLVNSATRDEDVLQWDMEGHVLLFSADDLKLLTQSFVAELSDENKERYLEAKATAAGRQIVNDRVEIESPLSDIHAKRLQLPGRKGYHQTWIDGRFASDYKAMGYEPVYRDPAKKSKGFLKFEETEANGTKHDMVAMEIPQHLYEAHLQALRLKDLQAVEGHKDEFRRRVDALNSRYGGRGKEVTPFVEETEEEEGG